ncbi:MAG: hypothetical protein WC859_10210 [Elusimicrobiota bacterium]|jgi:hypothetical protein
MMRKRVKGRASAFGGRLACRPWLGTTGSNGGSGSPGQSPGPRPTIGHGSNAALLFDRTHLETLCRVPGAVLPGVPAQVIDRVIKVRPLNSEGCPQER